MIQKIVLNGWIPVTNDLEIGGETQRSGDLFYSGSIIHQHILNHCLETSGDINGLAILQYELP